MNLRSRRVERKNPEPANDGKKWKGSTPRRTESTISLPKFSLQLTKEEIHEDFMIMTGKPPKSRPTKRPKSAQNNLNTLFPGSQLKEEVTTDMYKVLETPQPVKMSDKKESL